MPGKDRAAQTMVAKRWGKTTPEERSKIATELNKAKWEKYYREHPEKLKQKKVRGRKKAPK